jgi:hypothetical protein
MFKTFSSVIFSLFLDLFLYLFMFVLISLFISFLVYFLCPSCPNQAVCRILLATNPVAFSAPEDALLCSRVELVLPGAVRAQRSLGIRILEPPTARIVRTSLPRWSAMCGDFGHVTML